MVKNVDSRTQDRLEPRLSLLSLLPTTYSVQKPPLSCSVDPSDLRSLPPSTMSGRKRKAPEEPSSPRSSTRPQPANPTAQPTIGSLDCWPCTVSVHELAPDMLPAVFPGLSLGQQHLDLWTALTAHYGTEMDAVYDFWTRARGITMDDLREWKHGPEISSLPRLKVSGAQVATRMIKRLRSLEEEAKAQRIGGLKRALLLMELDYSMLMYGTKRSVLDVMIPDHKERLAYIRQSLGEESPKAKEIVVNVHVTGVGSQSLPEGSPKAKETVPNVQVTEVGSAGGQDTDWEQMVIGFKQELDPNEIPPLAGHRKVIETLEDLMEIPQLFPHLIKSRSNVGFQGILLFGPPGTGKTLLAQTLAARKGLTFYNVPADQLTSKWVGDTEKYDAQTSFLSFANHNQNNASLVYRGQSEHANSPLF